MKIAVPLRKEQNFTNIRNGCLAQGMEAAGHKVKRQGRDEPVPEGTDLVIHTAFAGSVALRSAIDQGIPFIIMEAPLWRGNTPAELKLAEETRVSYAYNGLVGGGTHAAPGQAYRPHPPLRPMKTEGDTIIFAQKPSDHSLRNTDHVEWLLEMQRQYPDAELRHHPLMIANPSAQEPIGEAIRRCYRAITFSSTTGIEALIDGCISEPAHPGSGAYEAVRWDQSREEWIHKLSYWNFDMEELTKPEWAKYILEGYDEARANARAGKVEHPRPKARRDDVMAAYYREFGNGR